MKQLLNKFTKKVKDKKGFTLMEMLIVVAIIVILVAISIPVYSNQMENAKKAVDAANLRAAKSVATSQYLIEGKLPDNTCYYDIENGELVKDRPTAAYGQSKDNKGKVIKITVDTTNETVNCEWDPKTSSSESST